MSSVNWRKRSTPASKRTPREREAAPVVVRYVCQECSGPHPRAECPTKTGRRDAEKAA